MNKKIMEQHKLINKPSETIKISLVEKEVEIISDADDIDTLICDNIIHVNDKIQNQKENELNEKERYDNCDNNLNMKNYTLDFNKELGRIYQGNNVEKKMINEDYYKEFNGMSTEFIIQNLKYDKRVKNYERKGDYIFVYFWSVADSISFYKQYFHVIDMNFSNNFMANNIDSNEFGGANFVIWREIDKNYNFMFANLSYNSVILPLKSSPKKETKKIVKSSDTDKIFSFDQRLLHFTNLSKFFSPQDLKRMHLLAENNDFSFLFEYTKELAVGITSNILMQESLKKMSQINLLNIINLIGYDMGPISATKYGAYVIQTLISLIHDKTSQTNIKKFMSHYIVTLIKHPIGNYAVQKILRFDPDYILDFFCSNFSEIINDDLGYKVFKKCFESFESQYSKLNKALLKFREKIDDKRFLELSDMFIHENC